MGRSPLLTPGILLTSFFQHNKEGDLVCPISRVQLPHTFLTAPLSGLSLTAKSTTSPGSLTYILVVLPYSSRMASVCPPPRLPLNTMH